MGRSTGCAARCRSTESSEVLHTQANHPAVLARDASSTRRLEAAAEPPGCARTPSSCAGSDKRHQPMAEKRHHSTKCHEFVYSANERTNTEKCFDKSLKENFIEKAGSLDR